ncbi:GTPase ObgE [Candidatus Aminicenantes bacterium AC-708-M15]|jgi:GTP-binding protein|nr:GTPase ObgE [SCandidatus Aminicenantes bacterium Aminicenantia_JdfR_composite]MCP2596818.1 GTPase ObgE [Candidatus Aminicenantes bacterium AC-335-G13]MCP2598279.1 GTPase ObgE [Candidatus Aminicenantes bacterium AC-335-L06]MCP2604018.1 GTPase ObgE [Candidatus Aminicenantes bacterium AC-708-M15]MCP2606495.1 GTPase ObgE [Candidatus Aminicenantes bacterium AC-708-I09]MCP2618489.1 GTPase ObgE [Candidatus Aminicenantes bacterium AC-335-A11]MCP2620931.1 GTPase ObgE [Candidatus Aminicenantes bacte
MFVDQVKIYLRAGKGGNGCVSFRREKYVPKGGPDGGRGGDGGSIFFVSDSNLTTLSYFRFHPHIRAGNGGHGEGNNRTGRKGEDIYLKVPVGTVIKDVKTNEILFDFTEPNQIYLAAKGGKGGRGNASFASPTNRAPKKAEPGKPGEEKELILELKLIADVGLIGFPNVGKSTLLSKISSAKPLIADYPFTTLHPNLGVVDVDEENSFVIADLPGLIENAHKGKGLGIRFLKHIERTKMLAHMIDVSPYVDRDPVEDYYIIMNELKSFNPSLVSRPQILIANKIDLIKEKEHKHKLNKLREFAGKTNIPFIEISALREIGLKELIREIHNMLVFIEKEKISREVKA